LGSLDRRKGSAPTVLLVEDVKVSRRVAEASLKKAQYRVATAKDGEEAVEKYKQYHEDLEIVLMDINVSLHLCEVYVVITS
jgi:CheY-like chemotaxis protein